MQTKDPKAELRRKIRKKDEIIFRWTTAEKNCTEPGMAGDAARKYCRGLVRYHTEKKAELEAALARLGHNIWATH